MYDAISNQLAVLASHPSASMREYATQNMTQLANDALTFLSNPLALSAEVAARHGAAYKQDVQAAERSILASYQATYASPFSDVKQQAGKEAEVRSAVELTANRVLDLLIEAVVSALCSLILDGRNQLREVTMSAVYIH